MTTAPTTAAAGEDCSGCGARQGSCAVRVWLSGRRCCESCDHPNDPTHNSRHRR